MKVSGIYMCVKMHRLHTSKKVSFIGCKYKDRENGTKIYSWHFRYKWNNTQKEKYETQRHTEQYHMSIKQFFGRE